MSLARFVVVQLAVLLVLSFGLYVRAQTPAPTPAPDIISGADIGFRLQRTLRGRAVGSLMVRVNGQWVEAWVTSQGGVVPLEIQKE